MKSTTAKPASKKARTGMPGAVKDSESLYRALFELSPDAILTLQRDRLIDCNQAALDMFGYDNKEALLSRHPGDLSPLHQPDGEESRTRLAQIVQTCLDTDKMAFEWMCRCASGGDFAVEIRMTPIEISGVTMVQAVMRDISERKLITKKLRAQQDYLQTILDASPIAIAVSDEATGSNRLVNRRFADMVSKVCSAGKQAGGLESWVNRDDRERFIEQLRREGQATGEALLRKPDGKIFTALITCQYYPDSTHEILWWVIDMSEQKETQRKLQHQEKMLEQVVDELPLALFVKDINDDYRYTIVNKKHEELFGWPAKTLRGCTNFDIQEPDMALKIRQEDLEITRTGEPLVIPEEKFQTVGGEVLTLRTIKLPILGADGKPSMILGICEDLTEIKETEIALRNSEIRFRQLAQNAPVGIFMTDRNGGCVFVNDQWQKMTGLNQEQAAGTGWVNALHEEDTAMVSSAWQDFVKGVSDFDLQYRFTTRDGQTTWVSGKSIILQDETKEVIGFLGSVTDITRHKLFEAELELSRDEARRANNAKSEFLSRMSHELRTPLNAVLGFGQLLQMNSENLTPDQNEGVGHILAGGEHLLHLIEDVLDFSRIEAGHMGVTLQKFSIDPVLRRSFALVSSLAQQGDITLIPPSGRMAEVIADPQRTQQIMINLLSNAIKYNKTGGTVAVSASAQPDNMLRISISDTGHGIHSEDQARLFQPFERITLPGSATEGTGIGLSICKKLVELMGGRIGFESELGKGSTFWFELPAALATALSESTYGGAKIPVLNDEIEGVRILYVEDHLASIRLMADITRLLPRCEFTAAKNATDGVALAKSSRPDLILMDINLPGLGGFEALTILQKDERTRDIPVIALSASASPDMIAKATTAGFAHFMAKPLSLDKLFQVIASVYETSP